MLIKFETKSNRVKGLSFHPKRPWILASLHTSTIQLWDYRMGTLIDTFDEHDGPVRGLDFHCSQPLFVSGGDDAKIRVWNYKLRRCLFVLTGHLDYIRTVEFHKEQPWIVSASDDQTIRIWNWQSRTQISVLTGHNHYVMSASFHPKQNLIVSASMDQTVRVWDISALKKKGVVPNGAEDFLKNQLNQEIFGGNDAMVKYILEGHDRGVNWAAFHPTLNLIVSAGDDKQVKLWKINDTRAWEVDTFGGHASNVTCSLFHAKKDLIVSSCEDKTLRFWDLNSNKFIKNYRRESRFWVMDVHPTQNLIAAGHDNGVMVFKLDRERPASYSMKQEVLYIKDKYLRLYDCKKNSDSPLSVIRRSTTRPVRTMSYNSHENYVLLTSDQDGGTYELFKLPKTTSTSSSTVNNNSNNNTDVDVSGQVSKGRAIAAVFTGLKKYAILDRNKKIFIKNVDNDSTREIALKDNIGGSVRFIFESQSGRILIKTDQKVHQYDFEQQKVINEVAANNIKYVVWSDDFSRVALLSKHVITICNSQLKVLCSVHETIRIKSGSFDENGVFIYTTLNHMKYCLSNGNNGTIKTLSVPIYIVKARTNNISFLDREGEAGCITIDSTEYRFKLALAEGKTKEIRNIIGKSKILGDSIIAYLQQKGYPEIAMRFVQEDETKYNLAIECGDIETAFLVAQKIDKPDYWKRLSNEAMLQGNIIMVEKCLQRTKDYDKLSFLYLVSGNIPNLKKMLKIATMREDVNSRFHNALYLGDVEERIRLLQEVGQHQLAYVTALTHGLHVVAESIKKDLDPSFQLPKLPEHPVLMIPPIPIIKEQSWPLTHTVESRIAVDDDYEASSGTTTTTTSANVTDNDESNATVGEGSWGDDDLEIPTTTSNNVPTQQKKRLDENGDEEEEPVDDSGWGEGLGDFKEIENVKLDAGDQLLDPTPGKGIMEHWVDNSHHPAVHIAAGSFTTAMDILSKACGITEFKPLKSHFLSIYASSSALMPVYPSMLPIEIALQKDLKVNNEQNKDSSLPTVAATYSFEELNQLQTAALNLVSKNQLDVALTQFRQIIHLLLFVDIQSRRDERVIQEMLRTCAEYVTALRLEITRRALPTTTDSNHIRGAELAAYFTKCRLQNKHLALGLKAAMTASFKLDNFLYASGFANRLLKLNPQETLAKQAKFVIQTKDQKPYNKHEMKYDERNPFVICNTSLTPIYGGSDKCSCAYCGSTFLPAYNGQLCTVCEIGKIGGTALGLYKYISQFNVQQQQQQNDLDDNSGW